MLEADPADPPGAQDAVEEPLTLSAARQPMRGDAARLPPFPLVDDPDGPLGMRAMLGRPVSDDKRTHGTPVRRQGGTGVGRVQEHRGENLVKIGSVMSENSPSGYTPSERRGSSFPAR